jgi:hypothetical protein
MEQNALPADVMDQLAGPNVAFRWSLWEPAIVEVVRSQCGITNAYNFQSLAREFGTDEYLHEYTIRPGGPTDVYVGPR